MYFEELGLEGLSWIYLIQDRGDRTVVSALMKLHLR
jgi:hypothetical protein